MNEELNNEKQYFLRAVSFYFWDNIFYVAYVKNNPSTDETVHLWNSIYCFKKISCDVLSDNEDETIKEFFEDNMKFDGSSMKQYAKMKKIWDKIKHDGQFQDKSISEEEALSFLLNDCKILIRECIDKKLNDSEEFPDYSSVYPFNLIICWQRIKHGSKWKEGQALVKEYFDEYIVSDQEKGSEKYYDIVKKHYDVEKEYYRNEVFN